MRSYEHVFATNLIFVAGFYRPPLLYNGLVFWILRSFVQGVFDACLKPSSACATAGFAAPMAGYAWNPRDVYLGAMSQSIRLGLFVCVNLYLSYLLYSRAMKGNRTPRTTH